MHEESNSDLSSQENIHNTLQDSKFSSTEDLVLSDRSESDPFVSKSQTSKKEKVPVKKAKKAPTKKTPPKAPAKKKAVKKESQPKTTKKGKAVKPTAEPKKPEIKSYLISLNKPFSIQEIIIHYKTAITKTSLTKILTELEKEGVIISKMYSKTTIYCTKQADENTNEDVIKQLDLELDDLKEKQSTAKQIVAELMNKLNRITKYPSDDNLVLAVEETKQAIVNLNRRIEALKGGEQIGEKEMSSLEMNLKNKNQKLKEIKQIFYNILDSLCEGLNMKRSALLEELEIEL